MEQNAGICNTMTHFLKSHGTYFIDRPPYALTKSRRHPAYFGAIDIRVKRLSLRLEVRITLLTHFDATAN
jgi:hypothetical protein